MLSFVVVPGHGQAAQLTGGPAWLQPPGAAALFQHDTGMLMMLSSLRAVCLFAMAGHHRLSGKGDRGVCWWTDGFGRHRCLEKNRP